MNPNPLSIRSRAIVPVGIARVLRRSTAGNIPVALPAEVQNAAPV
jgi:hypothetical protein